jgi:hypothetical protein
MQGQYLKLHSGPFYPHPIQLLICSPAYHLLIYNLRDENVKEE